VKLSVITPAFNEAASLPALHERLIAVLGREGIDWEWIIVDDHSSDSTPDVVQALTARDSRVRGVRFARNHGSHAAIAYGLQDALGDAAVMVVADLQDPPETIADMLRRWMAGAQVVWAVRRVRIEERVRTLSFGRLYYFIMRHVVGLQGMPSTGADFFLADRAVIDAINAHPERHVSLFALLSWIGFRQESLEYDKQPRVAGRSGWSLSKKLNLVSDSITAFSDLPLRAGGVVGAGTGLVGVVLAVMALAGRSFGPLSVGSSLILAGILVVGGLNLLMLGIVGEYLWRALDESRRRPRFVIERRFDGSPARATSVAELSSHPR
jgi:polyisoprenyl-phosphate glycosyltransferase